MMKAIIKKVANDLKIDEEVVKAAYNSFWKYIKVEIMNSNLNTLMEKEEFDKHKFNFNIPSLGKIYCIWEDYQYKVKYLKKIRGYNAKTEYQKDNSDV